MKPCFRCNGRGYHRKLMFRKELCSRCNGKGKLDSYIIVGVCLGWDAKPHIQFEDGTYFPSSYERIQYAEYFANGDWPPDPVTKEKLPIA